ncbi:MAG: hypothetical protein QW261_05270 [Candidatus Jordarchaeaceae archaeon]
MFEKRGVCLSIFDEEAGPISVYFKGIEKAVANKIALKSMISSLSLSQEVDEGESIIPLQEERKSAFVFYFAIKDDKARGGVRIGTLSFVVEREDSELLYRFAPVLAEHSKRVVEDVKKYYVYRQPVPQVLVDSVNSMLSIEFEGAVLPVSFKEYLIRSYLSRETTFHRSIIERTISISRNREVLGEKIDIVGADREQNIFWALISRNFFKMNNEEKRNLCLYINKLRENIPSLEVIFVLNELGLRTDGTFNEKTVEKTTQIQRTSEVDGKEFDLYGTDDDGNIVWALLSKNFLAMKEEELDEINQNIFKLKRTHPSMEVFFILAEVLRTTVIQPPKPDFSGKPEGIKKILGAKREYQELMESLRKKEK